MKAGQSELNGARVTHERTHHHDCDLKFIYIYRPIYRYFEFFPDNSRPYSID